MTRAFVAVDPSEEAREALAALQERLRRGFSARGVAARFSPPENLHLTLRFLGSLTPDEVADVTRVLHGLATTDRFEIAFGALGGFPSLRRPRVLWVGVSKGREALKQMTLRLSSRLNEVGIPTEERPYTPHLTLARCDQTPGHLLTMMQSDGPQQPIVTPVSEVVLYRSQLTPTGARYAALERVQLAKTA